MRRIDGKRIAAGVRAILAGESRGVYAGEDGMIAFITVLVVLFFAVLIGLVANVAYATREKVEVQNSADAVASSAALWQARGMNAVTAANHLMGELTALVVLQYSFGGPELDKGQTFTTDESVAMQGKLMDILTKATVVNPVPAEECMGQVTEMTQPMTAGAMFYDSRMNLQYMMWWAIAGHYLAGIVREIPYVGLAFQYLIDFLASALRGKIMQEWNGLKMLEPLIATTVAPRRTIEELVLPLVRAYADYAVKEAHQPIERSVNLVAERNGVTAVLYPKPANLTLPVEKEKPPTSSGDIPTSSSTPGGTAGMLQDLQNAFQTVKNAQDRINSILGPAANVVNLGLPLFPDGPSAQNPRKGYKGNPSYDGLPKGDWDKEQRSQWVRATYPWVNAWRTPIRRFMDGPPLLLSMSSAWYLHWSNRYTLAKSHEFRTSGALAMYVMKDSQKYGQGNEPWTTAQGSRLADKYFCMTAFVHRPAKTVSMEKLFGRPDKDGMTAYAQAMLYNANSRQPGSGGQYQPQNGWNTLNWRPPTSQSGAWEYGNGVDDPSALGALTSFLDAGAGGPSIQLNWQEKLTPVTQLREAVQSPGFDSRFREVLKKLPDRPQFRNH